MTFSENSVPERPFRANLAYLASSQACVKTTNEALKNNAVRLTKSRGKGSKLCYSHVLSKIGVNAWNPELLEISVRSGTFRPFRHLPLIVPISILFACGGPISMCLFAPAARLKSLGLVPGIILHVVWQQPGIYLVRVYGTPVVQESNNKKRSPKLNGNKQAFNSRAPALVPCP